MPDKIDEHIDNLDSVLDNLETEAAESQDGIEEALEGIREKNRQQRAVLSEIKDQDFVLGTRMLSRYYNTSFEDEETRDRAETDIDLLYVRHNREAPFEDMGLSSTEISGTRPDLDYSIELPEFVTRRRAVIAGATAAIGAILGTDFFNSFEGDHPGTGGVRFGQDDIDGWGAMEDPRAGYMSSPPCDKTDEEVIEALDIDAEVSDTFYEQNGEDLDVYVFQDGLLDYKGSMDYRGSLEGMCQ
ncbi:hypothetical protein [Candidatus Nanohalococcus occultus]|uniref:hypothetical protein n=1 Tax=Candidatus Nanohalococcus occultus TaxID=2978047 RepID=UPI0039E129DE